jgi:ATP synthase protein I
MPGAKISQPPAHRIAIAQALVLLLIWLSLSMVDTVIAYSSLVGGLVAVIPQAWFTQRVFRQRGAQAMKQIARTSYAAEIGKFLMAVAGFALVFALVRPLAAGAVFATYGVMLFMQVIGAWLLLRGEAAGNS